MPRLESEPIICRHIQIFKSDWDKLHEIWRRKGVKPSRVIRLILRDYLKRLDAKAEAHAQRPQELTDLDIGPSGSTISPD